MRLIEELRTFARVHRLDLHDPALWQQLMALDPSHPRPSEERQLYSIDQQLRLYRGFHERYPFTVVPPGIVDQGTLPLARQVANNGEITQTEDESTRHTGWIGGSGAGKTTSLRLVIDQHLAQGKRVVILDPKDDTTALAVRDERFLLLTPQALFNPLMQPSFLTREEFVGLVADTFCRTFFSAERTKAVVSEALTAVFNEHEYPSLDDVHRKIVPKLFQKRTFKDRDVLQGTANHLNAFARNYPGMYRAHQTITWEELFEHSLHLPTLMIDNETTFLYSLLVTLLYIYKRKTCPRGPLTHVLVCDEGNKFFSAAQNNIEQAPTTIHLQGLIREFGIALALTSVDYSSLHSIIKSNTYTTIAFNVNGEQETRALAAHLGLREEEERYFTTDLKKGECIIRFGDKWRHPILARFPKIAIEKHVTPSELATAEERLNRWSPDLPPEITTQPPATNATPQGQEPPTRNAQPTTPPAPQPPASTTAVASNEDETARPPIKLTVNEERLLRATIEQLRVATDAYRAARLARQTGQNAKDKLVTLGLLQASSILVRPGRGGNAVVLESTPAGCELIGRERAVSTKGGDGAQHRWCIQELAKTIPGAKVEVIVGGKSIDILVPYDPDRHQQLLFHMDNKEVPPGALVAVEVEASAPNQTALNNIDKNHAVGAIHTIVAVLPRHVEATTNNLAERVPRDLRDNYTVVDFFALQFGLEGRK